MAGAHAAAGAAPNGPLRVVRRLALGLGGALMAVLMLGVGTAAAAPVHFGAAASRTPSGWGGSTSGPPATGNHFGITRYHPVTTEGQIALAFAMAQIGKPYLWAGAGPNAYDCSGLAMAAWAAAGVHLDHYTGTQVHEGTPVARSALRAGDLVFFGTASNVYHVGIYVSADQGGLMVDAPHTGAFVRVEPIWWWDYYTAIRPG